MPLNARAIYPASNPQFVQFASRRSVVHSTEGIVACTQPLAARCGLKVLAQGGNAADAAVAVAAGLNLTEPTSTGIGGDMFCLFYNAKTKQVSAMNGSGRSGANCTLKNVRADLGLKDGEGDNVPLDHVHAVTVPGAAAGWIDTVERFGSGRVSMEQILAPAIELGEKGFPVSELSAAFWKHGEKQVRDASPNFAEMLKPDAKAADGWRAPGPGEIFKNPTLAKTFRTLATEGKKGFYAGRIAKELIKATSDRGGRLTLADLENHMNLGTEHVEPISLKFNGQDVSKLHSTCLDGTDTGDNYGVEIWEHPPNGQGIVALIALGIIQELEKAGKIPVFSEGDHNSAKYLHVIIEALRIAFADASWFVADPNVVKVPSKELISEPYLAERAKLFDANKASGVLQHGSPALQSSDTVYFAVTDSEGNGISFINSNYAGFGSAIIPKGCGFTLQNRGANFDLSPDHPNVYAPNKRPYHTIIPAMITNQHDGSLHSVYGVMGGFMQPQGHVQVLLNMIAFKMTPQAALDAPRVCIGAGMPDQGGVLDLTVYLEEGITEEVRDQLSALGHKVEIVKGMQRGLFGRGQVIRAHTEDGQLVYSAGSDPRGDGAAYPAL
jgi:gamma-glutamyltranspeptidase/glutathione hydrolase